jgi:hypothetical protein
MAIFRVRALYELIIEDEFEVEADDGMAALTAELWARERLRGLRVTVATCETYTLDPEDSGRAGLLDLDLYDPSRVCDHV